MISHTEFRIPSISDEVRISLEVVDREADTPANEEDRSEKLPTSGLAKKWGFKTDELILKLLADGLIEARDGTHYLSAKGAAKGGEFIEKSRFGSYFLWPGDLKV